MTGAIVKAHAYLQALTDGSNASRRDVAQRFHTHPEDVSCLLPLGFLSPEIVTVIFNGTQPADLSVRHLTREIELPLQWSQQNQLLIN